MCEWCVRACAVCLWVCECVCVCVCVGCVCCVCARVAMDRQHVADTPGPAIFVNCLSVRFITELQSLQSKP